MFISVEGIDGAGKTTQIKQLCHLLGAAGKSVVSTHEPGDWSCGKELRSILLGGQLCHPVTEAMLFVADRCEHFKQVIEPALNAKKYVICDRYNDSTRAYQCWGRGLDRARLESLFDWAQLPEPDVTLWLDIPAEKAAERRIARCSAADRIEKENFEFYRCVAQGFAQLAKEYPKRFIRIDAQNSVEKIQDDIVEELRKRNVL